MTSLQQPLTFIRLSDHFTYGKLLRFTAPSMGMMIFTSIYSVVDGLFVSNFAGKPPFAALNLIFSMLVCVGFLVGILFAIIGVNGIWYAIIFAELAALILTAIML